MAGLFDGTPQLATSYASSTSETPKWMQDAIFNQIRLATNESQKPYQEYGLETVAPLSAMQQQAYRNVGANQNAWQGGMDFATSGMRGLSTSGTADALRTAQNQSLRPGLVDPNLNAGQAYFGQAGTAANNIVGAAQPYLSQASSAAGNIVGAAQPYLNDAGTSARNILGAAQPYLSQAGATTAEALSDKALNAANPYLQAASQSSAAGIDQYMTPYQQNVMDVIARQGARNLSENLLPQVSDSFIKAGQFGGSRMGEFGSRALRDTQEAVLDKQAQLANQGYAQSLAASSGDLARQAQLAGTVGSISGADLSRILQGGAQYGNLGQTAGQLTGQQATALGNLGQTAGQLTGQQATTFANLGSTAGQLTGQQASALANLGQAQTTAGQTQQQFGIQAAQAAQQAQAQDYARQMQALSNVGSLTQVQNTLRGTDVAALEAAGQAQQGQQQQVLSAAQQEFQNKELARRQQLDWLSTQIRGLAPITPQTVSESKTSQGASYGASPLSQLVGGYGLYKGLTATK